jgi:cytosine permease
VRKKNYNLNEIKEWESAALISWGISSIITVFTYLEVFQLTNAYFLDSFLLGGIIYLFLKRKEIKNEKQ